LCLVGIGASEGKGDANGRDEEERGAGGGGARAPGHEDGERSIEEQTSCEAAKQKLTKRVTDLAKWIFTEGSKSRDGSVGKTSNFLTKNGDYADNLERVEIVILKVRVNTKLVKHAFFMQMRCCLTHGLDAGLPEDGTEAGQRQRP
jgi:hypothetical protein